MQTIDTFWMTVNMQHILDGMIGIRADSTKIDTSSHYLEEVSAKLLLLNLKNI